MPQAVAIPFGYAYAISPGYETVPLFALNPHSARQANPYFTAPIPAQFSRPVMVRLQRYPPHMITSC